LNLNLVFIEVSMIVKIFLARSHVRSVNTTPLDAVNLKAELKSVDRAPKIILFMCGVWMGGGAWMGG
jgi:hypothetical protein